MPIFKSIFKPKIMKWFTILFFTLVVSISSFAGLKSKHIIGEWEYVITLYNGHSEGSFTFSKKNGELEGVAFQSDGRTFPISKIKVDKKYKTLCFEIPRENDVAIEFILTVDVDKFKGKGWINDTDFTITGVKIMNQKN